MSTGAVLAQRTLDRLSPLAPLTFREVRFDAEFGLKETDLRTLLWFIPLKAAHQAHLHRLRFSLAASPVPPPTPAPPSDSSTVTLLEPPFLLPPAEERQVVEQLASLCRSPETGVVVSGLPEGRPVPLDLLARESLKLLDESSTDRGTVVLCLGRRPACHLIVRVTRKADRDSVFEIEPAAGPRVTVYSLEGDGQTGIGYAPLNRLARAVRAWREGAPALRTEAAPEQLRLFGGLREFAQALLEGYRTAWGALAALRPSGERFPLWYDLSSVEAAISYSVAFAKNAAGDPESAEVSFSTRLRPDRQIATESYQAVESRALLTIRRDESEPRLEIDFAAPGFVLSGEARGDLLRHILDSEDALLEEFGEGYRQFLAHPDGAVAFLAFDKDVPDGQFLVVWPGVFQGESRDFAFTCRYQPWGIGDIHVVMRLEEDARGVRVGTFAGSGAASPMLDRHGYEAFHNFFHSVRIWRALLAKAGVEQ